MHIAEIKAAITPVLVRHQVVRAGIFGSVANGTAQAGSDVDILIELNRPVSLLDFVAIKQELEDQLGRSVDLVEYRAVKPRLKSRILAEEVRVYG